VNISREQESRTGKVLPSIIVTGASGLVGRNFVNAARECFFIYAVARRSQKDAEVALHDNIRWLRCDIGDREAVGRLIDSIAGEATIDYIFHFAGYYDFTCRDTPEYRRTNVEGTRHLLEGAGRLGVKRFIFSSSMAVSDFSDPRRVLDERVPPDGDGPYARSKRAAEELVASFSGTFPCTISRLAVIYSDWCEYGPLYALLSTWLSGGVRSRFIAGRGETALPYLHVQDLNSFWMQIVRNHDRLSALDVLAASPSGCVSHNELHAAATQAYGEGPGGAVHLPVRFAAIGLPLMRLFGTLTGRVPFERPWMLRYVDRRMTVDATATHRLLGWTLKPRFHIMRRLLFLLENMKRDPRAWERKNLAMTKAAAAERPGLKIYNAMMDLKEDIVTEHVAYLTAPEHSALYPTYQKHDRQDLQLRVELMFQMLESSIRLGDHLSILTYAGYLGRKRYQEGFGLEELTGALEHIADRIRAAMKTYPGLEELQDTVRYETVTAMQLILDEIEDAYDNLSAERSDAVC